MAEPNVEDVPGWKPTVMVEVSVGHRPTRVAIADAEELLRAEGWKSVRVVATRLVTAMWNGDHDRTIVQAEVSDQDAGF